VSRTDCAGGLVGHGLEALLREGGTFQVLGGSNIATPCEYWADAMRLNARHGEFMHQRSTNDTSDERAICQFFNGTLVFAEIQFRTHEYDRCGRSVM